MKWTCLLLASPILFFSVYFIKIMGMEDKKGMTEWPGIQAGA